MERAYRAGAVAVITATSTLAAGVNLPARRVILRSLHQAGGMALNLKRGGPGVWYDLGGFNPELYPAALAALLVEQVHCARECRYGTNMRAPLLLQGIGPVSRSQYLQMVGRAGRAGHSAVGESFVIGKGEEEVRDGCSPGCQSGGAA